MCLLCYIMLCRVMLCYVMLCYVSSCLIMSLSNPLTIAFTHFLNKHKYPYTSHSLSHITFTHFLNKHKYPYTSHSLSHIAYTHRTHTAVKNIAYESDVMKTRVGRLLQKVKPSLIFPFFISTCFILVFLILFI